MKPLTVFSCFDGISGARVALDRLGIPVTYYASEINKYAIKIALKNYPDAIQLGDINSINPYLLPKIELLIGGSPCQDLSVAKRNREGLDGNRSGLFFNYVRLLYYLKPTYFLLENVASMSKLNRFIISSFLQVDPILINSSLVSAQHRKRLYWTNIKGITQPEDRGLYLKDILIDGYTDRHKDLCLDACYYKGTSLQHYREKSTRQVIFDKPVLKGYYESDRVGNRIYDSIGKSRCLSGVSGRDGGTGFYYTEEGIRKLLPVECERLQTFPEGYTEGVSNTRRYDCLGNAFTVDVIKHILSFM